MFEFLSFVVYFEKPSMRENFRSFRPGLTPGLLLSFLYVVRAGNLLSEFWILCTVHVPLNVMFGRLIDTTVSITTKNEVFAISRGWLGVQSHR